ncbi:6-bladed beta-propeller [Rhodohalobacter mucosus]|nr:6-bladed beta-propeller [Rhodohalobacter mucosus]
METNLIIGLEEQPFENQFGRPLAVRTDAENNIYVADRGNLTIKVFDSDGNYLRSLGGRGRGPGEFQDIELMELTPENDLVVMDRGNLQYTVISSEGDLIDSYPYNLSDQFFPTAIQYLDGYMLALFLDASPWSKIERENRDLFHVYSEDFQKRRYSFFPYNALDIQGRYLWLETMYAPGSFTLANDNSRFYYSPAIFTGNLYEFAKNEEGLWEYRKTLQGAIPDVEPYVILDSEEEYREVRLLPGSSIIYSSGGPYMGRILSINMGIFSLEDGSLIHFYGIRRENKEFTEESGYHYLDMYAQVFDPNGKILHYDLLTTMDERRFSRTKSFINWQDEKGNYYLIGHVEDVPVIRRFTVQIN